MKKKSIFSILLAIAIILAAAFFVASIKSESLSNMIGWWAGDTDGSDHLDIN